MFSGIFSFESALYMILYRKTLCEENTFGKRKEKKKGKIEKETYDKNSPGEKSTFFDFKLS